MAPKKITFIPVDIKALYAAAKPRSAKKKAAKKIRKVLDYEHSDGEEEPKRLPTVEEEPQEVVNLDQLSIKEEPQEPQPVVEIPKPAPIEPPLRRLRKKYVDSSDDEEPNYECLLAWGARKDREEIESFEFPVLKPPTLNDTFDFWVREKTYFSVFLMGEDSIHLKLDPGMFVFSEIKEALRDLGALKHKYMLRCREQFLDHYTFMDFIDQESTSASLTFKSFKSTSGRPSRRRSCPPPSCSITSAAAASTRRMSPSSDTVAPTLESTENYWKMISICKKALFVTLISS